MTRYLALFAAAAAAVPASAAVFTSPAPGTATSKATARAIGPMAPGDTLVGTAATSSTQSAYHLIEVADAPFGIYENRLTFANAGETGITTRAWIKGLPQSNAGVINTTGDSAIQTANASSPGFAQWYGFGKGERFYLQTFAVSTQTNLDYTLTLTSTPVTPADAGEFQPGTLTFSNGPTTTRRHMHIFDADLNPIADLSDVDSTTRGNLIVADLLPGTYYVGYGVRGVSTNLATPATSAVRNNVVTDFPDLVVAGQTTSSNVDLSFNISDGTTTTAAGGPLSAAYQVQWTQFTVVPEPATLGLLAIGGIALLRRR